MARISLRSALLVSALTILGVPTALQAQAVGKVGGGLLGRGGPSYGRPARAGSAAGNTRP
jgi:hypothetical protein